MLPISVLIQHPDLVIATGLHALLAGRDEFNVERPPRPRAALPTADVVITDLSDGMAAAQSRTRQPGSPAILVFSELETEWHVRSALESGVHGYLLHSAGLDEVLGAVRQVSRRQRYLSDALVPLAAQSLTRGVLTNRESDVLQLIAQGQCNKLIARNLGIGIGTVKTHVKGVMNKLDAQGRTHAVVIAAQRGLISPVLQPRFFPQPKEHA